MGLDRFKASHLILAKAIGVRLMFLLHCLLAVSRVSMILNESKFWIYSLGFLPGILEGIHAVYFRKGLEHKWISLGTLLFICLDIVPIWIMELDRADRLLSKRSGTSSIKISSKNSTNGTYVTTTAMETNRNEPFYGDFIQLDNDVFVFAIEQSFLLVMIIGRWTLPKGQMSRDKLSNLLLVLIGKACDMTDFFTLFSHKAVVEDRSFTFVVLVVWSISVFQFPISFTEYRDENLVITVHRDKRYMQIIVKTLNVCLKTEIWSIVASILMQEFPFLVCRSYAVGSLGIVDDTIIFFLFKNSLIITMYMYRLVSLCLETGPSEEIKAALMEVDTVSLDDVENKKDTLCMTSEKQTVVTLTDLHEDKELRNFHLKQKKLDEINSKQKFKVLNKSGNCKRTNKKSKVTPENPRNYRKTWHHLRRRSSL
ncbi:transmembrane protein 26-like [Saccostrea echinata]|uniref:transmembrane protein 26-like n=1 Tax=Saccostrea echinata TaxID=191078 RepID=UPI002A7FCD7D|nr:transmembrane protein 26-like [Saccostrea echinata]